MLSLDWLVIGMTVDGTALYPEANHLGRMKALRLYTVGSGWFFSKEGQKGAIVSGQIENLAVLSAAYFAIPDEPIKQFESVLAIVGGRVAYGAGTFAHLDPAPPPAHGQ